MRSVFCHSISSKLIINAIYVTLIVNELSLDIPKGFLDIVLGLIRGVPKNGFPKAIWSKELDIYSKYKIITGLKILRGTWARCLETMLGLV